jgi:short-subunit dehydrogenase
MVVWGLARRPSADVDRSVACDVRAPGALEAALDEALAAMGAPDVLAYAAGAPVMGRTLQVPEQAAREAFDVNFWGLDRAVRRVLPAMARRGGGGIVGVLSIAALRAVPHEAYYAASKAACARYLECLAHEARGQGVTVGYVAPGYIDTGFFERGGWYGMTPPKVRGSGVTPDDVARAALDVLDGRRSRAVIGWRETVIRLGDHLAPGLYDRFLRARARREKL